MDFYALDPKLGLIYICKINKSQLKIKKKMEVYIKKQF